MKTQRETKQCHICSKTIYRPKYTTDYGWRVTRSCSIRCNNLSSAIIRLTEMGYKIDYPIAKD